MSRRQCVKCPWRVTTDPREIPNGYDREKHRGLVGTIADPSAPFDPDAKLRIMACHESGRGAELPCVGWMHHQYNEGHNLLLRLAVCRGRIDADYELLGEQHSCLEDTLGEE